MNYFELMANYNKWMNRKLYSICAEIPDDQRREDMGAFFKSIHGTLNHLLFGDMAWMARFAGQSPEYRIGDEIHHDFTQLRMAREAMDERILEWAGGLTDEWLDGELQWTSRSDGRTRRQPRRVLVIHMFNHQTHHRGQLTTLIHQAGHDPGVTDIPWLPALEADNA